MTLEMILGVPPEVAALISLFAFGTGYVLGSERG